MRTVDEDAGGKDTGRSSSELLANQDAGLGTLDGGPWIETQDMDAEGGRRRYECFELDSLGLGRGFWDNDLCEYRSSILPGYVTTHL